MADQNFPSPKTQLVRSQPGLRRDGTLLATNTYTDMLWARFYQDTPRKMGGYEETERHIDGIVRCINMFGNAGVCNVNVGSSVAFQRFTVDDNTDVSSGVVDRTPAGYVPEEHNLWQADALYYAGDVSTAVIAAATPSLYNLTSTAELPCYYGDITSNDRLSLMVDTDPSKTFTLAATGMANNGSGAIRVTVAAVGALVTGNSVTITGATGTTEANGTWFVTKISGTEFDLDNSTFTTPWVSGGSCDVYEVIRTSGGICAIGSTTFVYGHDGLIKWSSPVNSFNFTGTGSGVSRPVASKVLKGMPLRGSAAPAGIFWSIDSVILAQYVGTPVFWSMTTITTSASLLGQNTIIENNGIYYWATMSGFTQFNGVVRDLPNEFNKRWFLDNMNLHNRNKCFAYKVPAFSEIWWCFPFGDAEECTHAVIYNYEKNYWYDTALPNGGRAAGAYNVTCPNPFLSGVVVNDDTEKYSVWSHESGVDEVSGPRSTSLAIRSYFETAEFSVVEPQQLGQLGEDRAISYNLLEPDYDQVGDLNLYITSRANARAAEQVSDPIVIPANPTADQQLVKFKKTGRLTRFKIESNVAGGNYVCGSPVVHFQPSDGRRED
jgi:hypothetical protein